MHLAIKMKKKSKCIYYVLLFMTGCFLGIKAGSKSNQKSCDNSIAYRIITEEGHSFSQARNKHPSWNHSEIASMKEEIIKNKNTHAYSELYNYYMSFYPLTGERLYYSLIIAGTDSSGLADFDTYMILNDIDANEAHYSISNEIRDFTLYYLHKGEKLHNRNCYYALWEYFKGKDASKEQYYYELWRR